MKCGGIDKRTGQACRLSQGHIGACASRTLLEKAQGAWDDWTEEDRKTEVASWSHRTRETLNRLYRVLTGRDLEEGRVVQQEEVVTLAWKLREDSAAMHRRAQRLEGIESHMATLRESHARELGRIMHRAQFESELWWSRYRSAVQQIVEAGVDDRIEGQDNYRTGNLSELVLRLVKERDDARGEAKKAISFLQQIATPKRGLETFDSDEERVEYWIHACETERATARKALESLDQEKVEGRRRT